MWPSIINFYWNATQVEQQPALNYCFKPVWLQVTCLACTAEWNIHLLVACLSGVYQRRDYHGFLSAQPTPSMHSCLFSLLVLILAVQYCQNMHSLLTLTLSVMLALLSVGHTHLSHQITQIDNHKDQHEHDAHNLQMSKTWVGNDGTQGDGQELTHGSHEWPEARAREGGHSAGATSCTSSFPSSSFFHSHIWSCNVKVSVICIRKTFSSISRENKGK